MPNAALHNISSVYETKSDCGRRIVTGSRQNYKIELSPAGSSVLRAEREGGRRITFHSLIDPHKEACRLCEKTSPFGNAIIVIVGAGSGYHVEVLTEKLQGGVVVIIEQDHAIIRHMMARCYHRLSLKKLKLYVCCENDPEHIMHYISEVQARHGLRQLFVFEHAPSVRTYPSVYQQVLSRLRAIARYNVAERLRYKKFKHDSLRILVLHSRYYLLPEIMRALKRLGHTVQTLMIETGPDMTGSRLMLEQIISEVMLFKPDFVITVNHLGFDREGILTKFFTDIELPYASWFVDSPTFILGDYKSQRSPYLALFLWDRDYCDDLRVQGYENVYYLPLATDTSVFRKHTPSKPNVDVGFVGNSGEETIESCFRELGETQKARKLIYRLASAFMSSSARFVSQLSLQLDSDEEALISQNQNLIERTVTWVATQQYRVCCVRKILKFNSVIHGDLGWHRHLNGSANILPELNYYDELPLFYPSCRINLNTTSLQMKNGMNQRVFDVPACGAFLLTDHRTQIEDAFRIGREVICYKHPDEIEDLCAYYLRHETDRMRIAEAACDRVYRDHTYDQRLSTIVTTMRRLYG